MINHRSFSILLMLPLAAGCSGGRQSLPQRPAAASVTALYGSTASGIAIDAAPDGLTLQIPAQTEARYLRLALPAGEQVAAWSSAGEDAMLVCLAPTPSGADLAIVPGDAAAATAVELHVKLGATRSSDSSLQGLQLIEGFKASTAGRGKVALTWRQVVPGDYNQDGSVTIADIKPLSAYWLRIVNRTSPDAMQRPAYWLDGNADGRIDARDFQPIQRNLGLGIAGYRVSCNGIDIAGDGPFGSSVSEAQATRHAGLPCTFSCALPGRQADCWRVVPVDLAGSACGKGVAVGGGRLDLGIDLAGEVLPIDTDDTPRFSTRVIVPIELIDGGELPVGITPSPSGVTISDLPRSKVLLADIQYIPAINHSALPRSVASVAGRTAVPVSTRLAFSIPADADYVSINARISLTANRSGGLMIGLRTKTSADGGPATTSLAELDYERALLRRDTNANGSLADELAFPDIDRDCISNAQMEMLLDYPEQGGVPLELKITGRVQSSDLGHGTLNLANVQGPEGQIRIPASLRLRLAEHTRLGLSADSTMLQPGEFIAGTVTWLSESNGAQGYWAKTLHHLGSGTTEQPALLVDTPGLGSTILRWPVDNQYQSYRIVRFTAPYPSSGPGGPLYFCAPNLTQDLQFDVAGNAGLYRDMTVINGRAYEYELYGLRPGSAPVFLGTS